MSTYTIPEDKVRSELFAVYRKDSLAAELTHKDIQRIVLVSDGQGLSGEYDRIHILFHSGAHIIVNAHTVNEMVVLSDAEPVLPQAPEQPAEVAPAPEITKRTRPFGVRDEKIVGLFHAAAENGLSITEEPDGNVAIYVGDQLRCQMERPLFDELSPAEILNKAGVAVHDE